MSTPTRRFQVFISSTFEDLRSERKAVMDALLNANYIPVGMEFFGAVPVAPWGIITKTIDISDYFVLVIGFRYGFELDDVGYTEREYDYAVEKGIPVLAFIQDRAVPVSKNKREKGAAANKKLDAFIERVKSDVGFKPWKNKQDLPLHVTAALVNAVTNFPRPGWYRFLKDEEAKSSSDKLYVFISALPTSSAEDMLALAQKQENLPFRDDLFRSDLVQKWDIAEHFGDSGMRLTEITENHIAPIKEYLKERIKKINSVRDITFFYAGPAGLPFHIGCLCANGPTPKIYQKTGNEYKPFGIVVKPFN